MGKAADTQVRPYKGTGKEMVGAVPSPPLRPPGPHRNCQAETIGRRMVQVVPRSTAVSIVISP